MSMLDFKREYTKEEVYELEVRSSKRLRSLKDNVVYLFQCEFVQIADYIAIIKQGDKIATTEYYKQDNGDLTLGNYDDKYVYLIETTYSDLLKAYSQCMDNGDFDKSKWFANNITLEEFEFCAWDEIYSLNRKYEESMVTERLYI